MTEKNHVTIWCMTRCWYFFYVISAFPDNLAAFWNIFQVPVLLNGIRIKYLPTGQYSYPVPRVRPTSQKRWSRREVKVVTVPPQEAVYSRLFSYKLDWRPAHFLNTDLATLEAKRKLENGEQMGERDLVGFTWLDDGTVKQVRRYHKVQSVTNVNTGARVTRVTWFLFAMPRDCRGLREIQLRANTQNCTGLRDVAFWH